MAKACSDCDTPSVAARNKPFGVEKTEVRSESTGNAKQKFQAASRFFRSPCVCMVAADDCRYGTKYNRNTTRTGSGPARRDHRKCKDKDYQSGDRSRLQYS